MPGIFISHIAEDKGIAAALKNTLQAAFDGVNVFVSSDYESIKSGDDWFVEIIKALKASEVVVVLCHKASILRPWINYEAGLGDGHDALVVPLTIRRFSKGSLQKPLERKQARDGSDEGDFKALLRDVSKRIGIPMSEADLSVFLEIARHLPPLSIDPEIRLEPFIDRQRNWLLYRIINEGDVEIELIHVKTMFPSKLLPSGVFWASIPPVMTIDKGVADAYQVVTHHVTDGPVAPGTRQDVRRLPKYLSPGAIFDRPEHIPMRCRDLSESDRELTIKFELAVRNAKIITQTVRAGDLNNRIGG